ncbi:MAG: ribonuclease HI [Actinomycetia bacterium]|nr:ribonuclease HI [Actinomycetes bacterium]
MEDRVLLYTDGACKGNPGRGGWGAWLEFGDHEKEMSGGEASTTNNRMELTAVIEGLRVLSRSCEITIVTDSTYVRDGVTKWMANWKRNGWRTAAKKPVKNRDLWEALDTEIARHNVEWQWVKGHSGHPGNERADALANAGVPG